MVIIFPVVMMTTKMDVAADDDIDNYEDEFHPMKVIMLVKMNVIQLLSTTMLLMAGQCSP